MNYSVLYAGIGGVLVVLLSPLLVRNYHPDAEGPRRRRLILTYCAIGLGWVVFIGGVFLVGMVGR